MLSASTAQAQNAPWCLQSSTLDGSLRCTYATFEQCLVDRQAKNGFALKTLHTSPPRHPFGAVSPRSSSASRFTSRVHRGQFLAVQFLFLAAAGGAGRTSAHGSDFSASGRPLTVDW